MIYVLGKLDGKLLVVRYTITDKGTKKLDIRQWYEKSEGKWMPTGGRGGSVGLFLGEELAERLARVLPKIMKRKPTLVSKLPDEGVAYRTTPGIYVEGKTYDSDSSKAEQAKTLAKDLKAALAKIAELEASKTTSKVRKAK